jgi:hypothetical protein
MSIKTALRGLIRRAGLDVVRYVPPDRQALPGDFDERVVSVVRRVRPFTMTSPERLFALIEAVKYVWKAGIPGDIVECGVWRGGSMMAAALTLLECGDESRDLYLFDTYEGMTAPTERDVSIEGKTARELLDSENRSESGSTWCVAPIDRVRAAMHGTGYSAARMHFIAGRVEDTIPQRAPAKISILRLDTDWYESTRHELRYLYPLVSQGGVLIIDDYGHWRGAREAVDEYIAESGAKLLLNRVDYTGRIAVKTQ